MQDTLLYLSEDDIARAAIPLDRLRNVVADAFAAQARGTAQAAPKSVLNIGPGHVFQAKPAVIREAGLAAMGRMSFAGPYAADLADLAAAQVVYETAIERKFGINLPR